ncbi:MAG: O-antigen ligase family protein [bacterium]
MSTAQGRKQSKGLFYYMIVIAYVGLLTIAFYVSAEKRGIIPVLPTILRYGCDAGVIALAVLYYLVTYMQTRMRVAFELAWVWSIPYVGMAMISLMIWISEYATLKYIGRGLINVGCAELNALAAAAAIWLFGEDVVDYTFYGAVAAVGMVAARAVMMFGPGGFIGQYIALLITFAGNTGPAMEYMEFHDLGQGLGLFVMYYVWKWLKTRDMRGFIKIILSGICFTLSLKRIDVLAIIGAVFLGWYLNRITFRRRWILIISFEAALVFFAYFYLIFIKNGYYGPFMASLGINTMSRDVLYAYYSDFYEIDPLFFGHGLRYIYVRTGETNDMIHVTQHIIIKVHNAHNEYMTYFIELGFWGFIFWIWSNSWYKMNAIRRRFGWEAMTFTMMLVVYFFISYVTDNTFFYFSTGYVGFAASGELVLASNKAKEYG